MENEALKQLLDERDAKAEQLSQLIDKVQTEKRSAFTDEENESRSQLVEGIKGLDTQIDEETAKAKRAEQLSEARFFALGSPTVTRGGEDETRVTKERTTYGPESRHSFFADIARLHFPLAQGTGEAMERLKSHAYEMAKESHYDSKEGRSAKKQYRELSRGPDSAAHRESMARFEADGSSERPEQRTVGLTTGGGATISVSGGAGAPLVIPPAFVDDWVPFRTSGRTFLDAIHHEPLPESGMSIYVPAVSGNASAAAYDDAGAQSVSESTPTLTMLSSAVVPEAGQVEITQVMLDRASTPSDAIIADSLRRALAPVLDTYSLTQALAGAGSIVDNSASWAITKTGAVGGLIGKLEQAKATVRTASGTFLDPNAVFFTPARLGQVYGAADSTGRPLVVPGNFGPYNVMSIAPDRGVGVEVGPGSTGRTGTFMAQLEVFQDYNIPSPASGNDQVVVLDTNVVWAFEGVPVPRVVPQTKANQLIVYIQLYTYISVLPLYPLGVEKLSGTFFSTPVWS